MAKKRAINSAAHDEVLQQLAKATQGITTAPLSGDIAGSALIKDSKAKGRKGARLSIAAAKHAIQTSPKSKQASLFDREKQEQDVQNKIQKYNIDKIGAVLSATEHRAFKAVAILLSRHKVYEKTDKHFRQHGTFLPTSIEITLQEYYEAYGVKRIINNRNEADYQAGEAREALQALIGGYGSHKGKHEQDFKISAGLVKPILQVYSRKAISGDKGKRDAIRTVEPFISVKEVYRDLSEKQEQALKDGQEVTKQLKSLIITPSHIMLAMGHLYLPEAVYKAVEQKYSGSELSPTLYNLIMILALDVHHDKGKGEIKQFQRNLEPLAYNLGKGQRIETRQKRRFKAELDKEAGKLRDVGAIKGKVKYTTGDGISGEQAQLDIVRAMFGTKDLPESEPLEELDQ